MSIVCNKKKLSEMIAKAQKAVNAKSTLDALKCVCVEGKSNTLSITGYDMEMGAVGSMEAKVDNDCKFIVNASLFGDIVRKLSEEEVTLSYFENENKLHINSGNSNFSIVTGNLSEYPALPKVTNDYSFTINSKVLKNMISKTLISISQDVSKVVLTGALLEIEQDSVTMASIDGYRLSTSKEMIETGVAEAKKVIVPGKILNAISSVIGSLDADIEIMLNDKVVGISIGDTSLSSNLIEGEFVDYKKLLPKDSNIQLKVNKSKFLNTIDRACSILLNEKNSLVKFSVEDEHIRVVANSDLGGCNESVSIDKIKGDGLNIAFNARYLCDALKVITSDEVVVNFDTNVTPCTINPVNDEDFTYLLLPVRLSN